jgi:hypothetical protein
VAPPTSTDKIGSSMEQTFDAIQAREGGQQSAPSDVSNPTDPTPEPIEAPLGSRLDLDIWAQTPRAVQELIMARERETHEKIAQQGNEIAELKKAGGHAAELASVLDQFTPNLPPHIAQLPRVQQIGMLFAASEALDRDPVSSIQQLAAHYGINLAELSRNPQAEAQAEQQRQAVTARYEQQVQYLQHQIAQLQSQQAQHQQQRQGYFQEQFENFIRERADYWSPELEDEVVRQVNAVKESNPSLAAMDPFGVVKQAEERARKIIGIQAKQDAVEAKKKIDAAKRHSSLNVKTTGLSRSPSNVGGSMWDNDAWDQAYSRASGR